MMRFNATTLHEKSTCVMIRLNTMLGPLTKIWNPLKQKSILGMHGSGAACTMLHKKNALRHAPLAELRSQAVSSIKS